MINLIIKLVQLPTNLIIKINGQATIHKYIIIYIKIMDCGVSVKFTVIYQSII